MKIKREVNGETVEFELTFGEMQRAYKEFEHDIDIETVDFYAECYGLEVPDDKMDEVANCYRHSYDKYLDADNDVRSDLVYDALKEVFGYDN